MAVADSVNEQAPARREESYAPGAHPDLPPPLRQVGPIAWIRNNLFGSPFDIALTLMVGYVVVTLAPPLLNWAVFDATWSGDTRQACTTDGACWVFVKVRFNQFVYGFYPQAQHWRVNLTGAILAGLGLWLLLPRAPAKGWVAAFALIAFPFIAYLLLAGGYFGLSYIESARWGGVSLTIIVAVVGIAIALAFGVLLALGRRSSLPVISGLCTTYIEFIRAIPLITILFMASVMLPLFLPEGVNFAKVLRAIIGTALFWSAYMAEAVRGGLQAVPRGQYEAAEAIGLSYWRSMGLVVLPQALKYSIPGIVNTIISLVKDTTLLLLIGIFELLGMVQAAASDPQWLGNFVEGYVFVALVFFIFCFGLSRYSQHLERKLDTGH
jgi:general L-amino acid transport system permease protein